MCRQRSGKDRGRGCACRPGTTALHRQRCAAPSLPRWRFCRRRVRRLAQGCSWCGGRESARRARPRLRGRRADRAGYPSRPASGRGKTRSEETIRAGLRPVVAALFPGWCGRVPRGWWKAAIRARAGSQQQSIFLRAAVPTAGARSQYVYEKDVPPLRPRRRARACIRCSGEDQRMSKPSRGWSCALRSACGSTRPRRASAGTDWSGLCLRAAVRAAGVRSQYKESQTDWLRSARRRLRAWLFPCSVQTYTHSPWGSCGKFPPEKMRFRQPLTHTLNYAMLSPNFLSDSRLQGIPIVSSTGHSVPLCLSSRRKRFRRHLFYSALIQPQDSMAPSCEGQVVGGY